MIYKKLRILLIFSKLLISKLLISNYCIHLYKIRQNPWDRQNLQYMNYINEPIDRIKHALN